MGERHYNQGGAHSLGVHHDLAFGWDLSGLAAAGAGRAGGSAPVAQDAAPQRRDSAGLRRPAGAGSGPEDDRGRSVGPHEPLVSGAGRLVQVLPLRPMVRVRQRPGGAEGGHADEDRRLREGPGVDLSAFPVPPGHGHRDEQREAVAEAAGAHQQAVQD
eukprot:scaffold1495_cov248-Pinguiococcus_pyrenoidosus.AAC.8